MTAVSGKILAYNEFLKQKVKVAQSSGFDVADSDLPALLKGHQHTIVKWALKGGKRAIFASFGLGKTVMQLVIAQQVINKTGKPFMIGLPLAVAMEFANDAQMLGYKVKYVTCQEEVTENIIYLSNYDRIRMELFTPDAFGGVSFDEGSVIRNLDTETSDVIQHQWQVVKYRFICTATPSPNEFVEILNYAHFLGIMDRGQALTRFFGRNSTSAGDLQLYEHKKREFWLWVASWAMFITKPSDLGYDDTGYDLPEMTVHYHMVNVKDRGLMKDRDGQLKLISNPKRSLPDAAKEKRDSVAERVSKAVEIINNDDMDKHWLIWHHTEREREAIEKAIPECKTVYGSQNRDLREEYLIGFAKGDIKYLATKPEIAGSGCNFQKHCADAVFVGIDYKFNDFIQAIHRIYRFLQVRKTNIHLIYTDAEDEVLKELLAKWERHKEMVKEMTDIIKEFGLNNLSIERDMQRQIGVERRERSGNSYRIVNNDTVPETMAMADNSVHLILSSFPFGNLYEYAELYNDFGHNEDNAAFFRQLDWLMPELLRVLQPGRIMALHVKDRMYYSHQNGTGRYTVGRFSDGVADNAEKHGFHFMGRITITTDVVSENHQTYRLGWTEQCKDGSKMGVGMPEYILLFFKQPTDTSNSYGDERVVKTKQEYPKGNWQLDAHSFWKSSGNRLLTMDELKSMDLSRIKKYSTQLQNEYVYDYEEHCRLCNDLDHAGRLPSTYMLLPPASDNEWVWDDVNRMRTLNSEQVFKGNEKHVCPLQFDVVDRLITRYTNKREVVFDPFGGIMTVPYRAIALDRVGVANELNAQYFDDGYIYCRNAEMKLEVPTLF